MFKRQITLSSLFTALLVAALSASAAADNGVRGTSAPVAVNTAPVAKFLPVASWNVDIVGGQAALGHRKGSTSGESQKVATDLITSFRPLAGCRLYDSRTGNPSALGIVGGSWFANNRRTLAASGFCGIPAASVTGLSLAINVFNYNAPATGRIAMMPVGAGVGGNQVGLSSTPWFWTAATVATSSNGNFDVQMFDVVSELIIDVNGYYQNSDLIDSTTQMDINYSGVGDAFGVNVLSTTTATGIAANNSSTTGTALRTSSVASGTALSVSGGKVRVPGAGVGTGGFVFQFAVNTAGTASAGTGTGCFAAASDIHIMTHPMTDANPGAVLFITPKSDNSTVADGNHLGTAMYRALYLGPNSCNFGATGPNKWAIQDANLGTIANGAKFNIMVITP